MHDLDWLSDEAMRQGLELSKEDLDDILRELMRTKQSLQHQRPQHSDGLEPPYRFGPPVTKPLKEG